MRERPSRARVPRIGGRVVAALLVVLAAACSSAPSPPPEGPRSPSRGPPAGAEVVPVTKVTDGDTIHVTYRGVDERVRLIGINTPEVDWYGGQAECFGAEAGRYAQSRLSGRTVGLEFDAGLRDRYHRLLAYVYVGSEFFNLTLVELGYATADPVEPDTSRETVFERAQEEARAAGRGLWSACPAG